MAESNNMLTEMDTFFMLTLPPWKVVATACCLLIMTLASVGRPRWLKRISWTWWL